MENVSSSINKCAVDEHLSPATKEGLMASLVSKKKKIAKEIISISKKDTKEGSKEVKEDSHD